MEQGSVTRWIQQMRAGDSIVVNALAERYFKKLGMPRDVDFIKFLKIGTMRKTSQILFLNQ